MAPLVFLGEAKGLSVTKYGQLVFLSIFHRTRNFFHALFGAKKSGRQENFNSPRRQRGRQFFSVAVESNSLVYDTCLFSW